QHPILFTTTVFKNLEFGLKIRKVRKKKRARIIEEALELVGMSAFTHARAHRLSGGETQRVALARALAVNPSVLLCDEPTASVDVENQEAILKILARINEQHNISIIFTSHNRAHVARLAHHTLFLESGKLAVSVRENLFPAIISGADDEAPRCVIPGVAELHAREDETRGKNGAVKVLIDPDEIALGQPDR
ncbi:MAG: ATP-binding cassette domain-containing protein, partial [Desulfobacterales bacterium]|nr:ATP-binding cassette domain-containing protein [Desulfobacterales bacterium]